VVSLIWPASVVLSLTGESGNSIVAGLFWLAAAIAFTAPVLFLGRGGEVSNGAHSCKQQA
jgi:hypothetical protein